MVLDAGIDWAGGYDIGDSTAELRGNGAGASAPPLTLFTASSRVTQTAAPSFRVGFAVTPRFVVEGGVSIGRPRISVAIDGDAESEAQVLPGEKLDQYQIDGGLTWQLPMRTGSKVLPFAAVGGGYLRQLHEDRALAETGRIVYGGGGVRLWLRGGRGNTTAVGIRGEARINVRSKGIDFEGKQRTYPSVRVSLFVGL